MSNRIPNEGRQERIVLTHAHGEKTATGSESIFKATVPGRYFFVENISYVNETGLLESETDHALLEIKNGATVIAAWSTETGADGDIAAGTFVDLNMGAITALAPNDVLSFAITETGDVTLPPGRFQIDGRYL